MKLFEHLRKKASKTLSIIKTRFYDDDKGFLEDDVVNLTAARPLDQTQKEESFFDSLRNTYIDIAESDPESALKLIQEELNTNPPRPVIDALIEIERYIRKTYCGEYFRGIRNKSLD